MSEWRRLWLVGALPLFVVACASNAELEPAEALRVEIVAVDGRAVGARSEAVAAPETPGARREGLDWSHALTLALTLDAARSPAPALDVELSVQHGQLRASDATLTARPRVDATSVPRVRVEVGAVRKVEVQLLRGLGEVRVWAESDVSVAGARVFGVSNALLLPLPSIAAVQGWSRRSPYAGEHVVIDCAAPRDVRVTGVEPDGFYVSDVFESRGYASLFVHAPPGAELAAGVRLGHLEGWVNEFYGLTELTSSGFAVATSGVGDEAGTTNKALRPVHLAAEWHDAARLERWESSLVEVRHVRVAAWFGPALARDARFGVGRSNCDFDADGRIAWSAGSGEASCALACAETLECTEWSQYRRFGSFKVSTRDGAVLNLVAPSSQRVAPSRLAGHELARVVGHVRHFEPGHPAFSVELRGVADLSARVASSARAATSTQRSSP